MISDKNYFISIKGGFILTPRQYFNMFHLPQRNYHMKPMYLIPLLLALAISINAQESEKSAGSRVLIAMEQTPFKKKLINKMKALLENRNMRITMVKDSEKEIRQYKAADYDLVFITNSGVWSKVRPWITEWIDANKADSAKILLHTTKKLKWQEDVYVDAVSSASSKKLADKLAEDYVNKLLGKR